VALGVAFGWFLERGGMGNGRKLAGSPAALRMRRKAFWIGQHELTQILRPRCAEDAALVSLSDQPGKVAHVVEVGVCEDDCIQAARRHREFVPVPET